MAMQSSINIKPKDIQKDWYLIDANGRTLGRLATAVARILRGKHKPEFTPHLDTGDYVIIINAEKIHVTGKKLTDKKYYHHSGYIGGIKSTTFDKLLQKKPSKILEEAIKGMLPKGPLGRKVFSNLKIYKGKEHPHVAQNPKLLEKIIGE
jgi:large subunit ribosomal protein L13